MKSPNWDSSIKLLSHDSFGFQLNGAVVALGHLRRKKRRRADSPSREQVRAVTLKIRRENLSELLQRRAQFGIYGKSVWHFKVIICQPLDGRVPFSLFWVGTPPDPPCQTIRLEHPGHKTLKLKKSKKQNWGCLWVRHRARCNLRSLYCVPLSF